MAKGPKNAHARKEPDREELKLSEWYSLPGADQVTRRRHVFGLLGWYHHRVLLPNLGIKGVLTRAYLRVFGFRMKLGGVKYNLGYINRVSPWMSIDIRARHQEEIVTLLTEVSEESPPVVPDE